MSENNQAGIQCDFCDKWIHADCIGQSEEEYLCLRQSDEEWFCNKCKQELQDKLSPRAGQWTNDTENENLYQAIKDETIAKGISADHVNIRGLVKNFNELRLLLHHVKFDMIAITEAHLTENVDSKEVYTEEYNIHRMDRQKIQVEDVQYMSKTTLI